MGIFEHFPYANYQDFNLDWVLTVLKKMEQAIGDNFSEYVSAWIEANYDKLFFQASYDADTETITISRGEV